MSLYACLSLEVMLRQASQYGESSNYQCVKVSRESSLESEQALFLLYVEEIGPHVHEEFHTFEAPKEKGNWGFYSQKLLNIMQQQQHKIIKCVPNMNVNSIFPDEDSVFFDLQYRKWISRPIDVQTILAEEPDCDWELVEDPDAPTVDMQGLHINHSPIQCGPETNAAEVSHPYRDALLKYAEREERDQLVESHIRHVSLRAPWKPLIVVEPVSYQHLDRYYGPNAPSIYRTIDDDEDDGIWGLVDSVANDKLSHGVSRVKGFTVLKPNQLAKKTQRIAAKAQ